MSVIKRIKFNLRETKLKFKFCVLDELRSCTATACLRIQSYTYWHFFAKPAKISSSGFDSS